MQPSNLKFLFHPKSVAVFGASTNPQKSGYKLIENLKTHQFSGHVFPINPKGGEILGFHVYPTLKEIVAEIDVAIIFVPNKFIPAIISECIEKKVKGAIIEAAGFGEVGEYGNDLVNQLIKITGKFTKIRILGPNCTGITSIFRTGGGFYSSFVPMPEIQYGGLAIVTQSGFLNGGYFLDITSRNPYLGFSYIAAIGNKMDINENDLIEFFNLNPEIHTIGLYIESFKDVRTFIRLSIQAKKNRKRILLLRSGQSATSQQAIKSHTGALAEKQHLIQAVIKQSQVIEAEDFRDFFRLGETIAKLHQHQWEIQAKRNLGVITISGGAGAIIADLCEQYNLKLPNLSPNTISKLKDLYPSWMDPNPFGLCDIWPAVENAAGDYAMVMTRSLEILLNDPNIEIVVITAFYSEKAWQIDWKEAVNIMDKYRKPVFIWLFGQKQEIMVAENLFNEMAIPVFDSERDLIYTIKRLA